MVERHALGSFKPSIDQNGIENGTTKTKICNRRIAHTTTATVDNNRFTSLYTLDIRPEKKESKINPVIVHQRIFDAIKAIDDTAAIITSDNNRITHSKYIPSGVAYKQMFPDIRTDTITKRIYLSFTLESTFTLSQLKYGSKYDGKTGIFKTLRKILAFIKVKKSHSLIEASIGFFLGINPKITLRNVLKQIDEICTLLDLDDDDMKAFINHPLIQTQLYHKKISFQHTIFIIRNLDQKQKTKESREMHTKFEHPPNTDPSSKSSYTRHRNSQTILPSNLFYMKSRVFLIGIYTKLSFKSRMTSSKIILSSLYMTLKKLMSKQLRN